MNRNIAAMVLPLRQQPEVATDYYVPEERGATARTIFVSRESFARFFDITPEIADEFPDNCNPLDLVYIGIEFYGFKIRKPGHRISQYSIKVIDFHFGNEYEQNYGYNEQEEDNYNG